MMDNKHSKKIMMELPEVNQKNGEGTPIPNELSTKLENGNTSGSKVMSEAYLIGLLYRTPFYLLFPSSASFFTIDYLLYEASNHNLSIYMDVTTRFGMAGDLGIIILGSLAGSLMLIATTGVLLVTCIKSRLFNWMGIFFILLGVLSHPWVFGILLKPFLPDPFADPTQF